jgi:hypothetical protein
MDAPTERTCRKCGETKALELFRASKDCRFGFTFTCKACDNARHARAANGREHDLNNAPAVMTCRMCDTEKPFEDFTKQKSGRWGRATFCRQCASNKTAAWRDANPQRSREWFRSYMATKREESYDAHIANTMVWQARSRGAEIVELVYPLVVLERDDGVCGICEQDVDPFDFQVDHIVACRDGGEHSYANVQVAHPRCNVQKGVVERDARKAAA